MIFLQNRKTKLYYILKIKFMKYIFKSACMLLMLLVVVSCADKNKLIVKTWTMDFDAMQANAKVKSKEDKARLEESTKVLKNLVGNQAGNFEFKADGIMSTKRLPELVRWKIEGSKLLMMTKDGGFVRKIEIVKLTSDKLVLDFKDGNLTYLKARK